MNQALAPGSAGWPATAALVGLLTLCHAAPAAAQTACYVRAESRAAAPLATSQGADTRAAQSHVGMRRKSDKLFELDISVAGADNAVCTVGGVARLSGAAGKESLAMAVRPDPSRKGVPSGTLCQVFVHLTATAVELRTTPRACRAQALCEGRVELDGQRFDATTRLAADAPAPCFERRVP